jgi:hypothetical protein
LLSAHVLEAALTMAGIGTLSENSLHAAIKQYLVQPGDLVEHPVDSFIVDIVRGETLFEIQVKNLYSLRHKLDVLLKNFHVHVVHPIPQIKWVLRLENPAANAKKRKSPKKCSVYHAFDQLVYLCSYIPHPNFTLDILMIEQEDILINDGKGSWRRKGWSLTDQRLLKILDHIPLCGMESYTQFLPDTLNSPFRTIELASAAGIPVRLAQKMAYTMTYAGLLFREGKKGNAYLYNRTQSTANTGTDRN